MNKFELNKHEVCPPYAWLRLEKIEEDLGFIPNIYILASESNVAFDAFFHLNASFSKSQFTPIEREVIQLVVSVENNCSYCVAGHSLFADNLGFPKDVLDALRNGQPISDERLQGLSQFTRCLIRSKGKPEDNDIADFFDLGFDKSQAIELILGIALKTFTNILSRLSQLPLDTPFMKYQWTPFYREKSHNHHSSTKLRSDTLLNL